MTQSTVRTIFRWIHIVLALPIVGYIYSPFDKLPAYAPITRHVYIPILVLSGLWLWKGHVVRRLISRISAPRLPSTAWGMNQVSTVAGGRSR